MTLAQEIIGVKEIILAFKSQVNQALLGQKETISELKLKFGSEVLRIDRNNLQVIDRLEKISNMVDMNKHELEKIIFQAQQEKWEAKKLFDQATIAHESNQVKMNEEFNKLVEVTNKIALKEGELANAVGSAMLQLKEISNEQYLSLKNIAFEKMGVQMLWAEKEKEKQLQLQQVQDEREKVMMLRNQITERQKHGDEVSGLKHKLHLADDSYRWANDRLRRTEEQLKYISKYGK